MWWAKNPRGHKNTIFTKQATTKAHPMSLSESSKQGLLKPSERTVQHLNRSSTHLLAALSQKTTALWSLCFIIQIYASPSPNRYKPVSAFQQRGRGYLGGHTGDTVLRHGHLSSWATVQWPQPCELCGRGSSC